MAKKKQGCRCYDGADKALREHGAKMPVDLQFDLKAAKISRSGRMRIVVEKFQDPKQPKKRRSLPMLTASYCPMCGTKYPEDMP